MAAPELRMLFVDCAPFMGGAQESLWTLLAELHRRDVTVGLICANRELERRAESYNIPCQPITATHWPASFGGLMAFRREKAENAPDFRQCEAYFQPDIVVLNTVRAALLWPELSPKCVIHDRDVRMPAVVPWLLARKCRNVIAISEAVAQKWRRFANVRTAVIPNMLDTAGITAANCRRDADDGITLALVADFVPWKNHRDFVAMAEKLRQEGVAFKAVIKGRARDKQGERCLSELKQDIRKRGLQNVIEINAASEDALPVMERADIVFSTATDEPFGRTALEALAMGKPFICYNSGGFADILRDCQAASPVKPRDIQALVNAALDWMPANKRRAMADNARQFAQNFDISSITPIFIEYFLNP